MFIMSAANVFMAITLMLLSIVQKAIGMHALLDYSSSAIFILIAVLATVSALSKSLPEILLGATVIVALTFLNSF